MSLFTLKDRTVRMYAHVPQTNALEENNFKETRAKTLTYQKGFPFKAFFPAFETPSAKFDNPDKPGLIIFKEVKKISFDFSMGLGMELGLNRAFLQPWFIEPAKISISGASYFGAFNGLDTGIDDDVEKSYNLFISSFAELKGSGQQIAIEIVNNPKNAQRFLGYITKFSFDESVDSPYVLNYQIDYVGKPDLFISGQQGITNQKKNYAAVSKISNNSNNVIKGTTFV